MGERREMREGGRDRRRRWIEGGTRGRMLHVHNKTGQMSQLW